MIFPKVRHEAPEDLFAVVAEWSNQGPILMETEGPYTSHDAAQERVQRMLKDRTFLRVCIVRLVYESGNALILHDMKRMQVQPPEAKEPAF